MNACILLGFPGKSVAPQTLKSSVSLPHKGYRISPALHLLFLMIPDGSQWKIYISMCEFLLCQGLLGILPIVQYAGRLLKFLLF